MVAASSTVNFLKWKGVDARNRGWRFSVHCVRGVSALCFQGAVDSKSGRKELGKKAGHLEPVSKFEE